MNILPSVTTIFDWRGKLEEVKALGLKQVALFLTCANPEERQEIYEFLKDTKIKEIPFVHLRTDMTKDEIDYLIKNYHTQAFNIHSNKEFPYPKDIKRYKNMVYIENVYGALDENEIKQFAGICLDFSHLEEDRRFTPDLYAKNIVMIEKYGCGCNHLSPAKSAHFKNEGEISAGEKKYPKEQHPHFLNDLSQLDYLKGYPKKYFSKFPALELENSIEEQLEAKAHIELILSS